MLTPILVWGHPLCGHCHAGARQWSSVTKCRSVLVAAAAGAQSGDLISNQIPAHGPTRPRVSLCFPSGRGKSRNHSASASLRRERNIYTSFSRHKRKRWKMKPRPLPFKDLLRVTRLRHIESAAAVRTYTGPIGYCVLYRLGGYLFGSTT